MNRHVTNLLILFFTLLSGVNSISASASIEPITNPFNALYNYNSILVSKKPYKVRILDTNNYNKVKPLTLTEQSDFLILSRLQIGDYISFESLDPIRSKALRFSSLNFVGLSNLIGVWMDSDQKNCVIVRSFTEMSFFPVSSKSECLNSNKEERLNWISYTINPGKYNQWVVLISEYNNSYLADLKLLTPTLVKLVVYNFAETQQPTKFILDKISD